MSLIALMAGLPWTFDATQVAPDAGALGAVPAGWYSVIVDDSSIESTKDGQGAYIKMKFKIIEPQQFANRVIFQNFNIKNNNQQAVDIAMGQLSALSHAVGVLNWQDTMQLHQIPMKVRVKVRAASGEYEASNQISAFKPVTENVNLGPEGGAAGASVPVHAASQAPQIGAPQIGAPQVQQPLQQQQPPFQQQWSQQPQQQAPVQQQQPVQQAPVQQQVQQPWEQQQQAPVQQAPVQQAPVQQQMQPPVQQQQPVQQAAPAAGAAVPPWVNQQ